MIAIIDYGASNLQSVCNALSKLNQTYKVVSRPRELADAKKVILPGVGAAEKTMKVLLENGFIEAIPLLRVPFLGICLGLQLLADFSEEGNVECLSIISGRVKKFSSSQLKIPQIGWNKVEFTNQSRLFKGIPNGSYFYFVHSFYFEASEKNIVGKTNYGIPFASIVQRNNFYATQFHPEKSGLLGLKLLHNFCKQC